MSDYVDIGEAEGAAPRTSPSVFRLEARLTDDQRRRIMVAARRLKPMLADRLTAIFQRFATHACRHHRIHGYSADGARRAIDLAIRNFELSPYNDPVSPATVDRYLAVLREAGVVEIQHAGAKHSRIVRVRVIGVFENNGGVAFHQAQAARRRAEDAVRRRKQKEERGNGAAADRQRDALAVET